MYVDEPAAYVKNATSDKNDFGFHQSSVYLTLNAHHAKLA